MAKKKFITVKLDLELGYPKKELIDFEIVQEGKSDRNKNLPNKYLKEEK